MKQVEVTILGQGYLLACPEGGEARLESAVAAVDREMTAIRDAGRIKARERIAVLAALNLAYQLTERPASNAAAGAARQAVASAPPSPPGADEAWQRLIERLDAALGDDGHLL
jgi:cell division protein ZapA